MLGIGRTTRVMRADDVGTGAGASDGTPNAQACGMVAGTQGATPLGWRRGEAIPAGDTVMTFDGVLQVVTKVTRGELWPHDTPCPHEYWPLEGPEGALGNAQAMLLLPEQSVVIESEVAEVLYGDAFALIPASALDGFRGIARVEP